VVQFQHHVAVGAERHHPVVMPHAHRGQRAGEPSAAAGQLAVGEGALPVDDRGPVGEDRGRAVEEGRGRQRGEGEHCHATSLSRAGSLIQPQRQQAGNRLRKGDTHPFGIQGFRTERNRVRAAGFERVRGQHRAVVEQVKLAGQQVRLDRPGKSRPIWPGRGITGAFRVRQI
jgi:hypothetical protein